MADPLIVDAGDGARTARLAPAFDFVVEPGKAAEFARATGADPRSVADLAPVTFPASSALWMDPEHSAWFGIERDYRNVLHGEQRFEYPHGPLPIGIALRARQRFGRSFEKPGRRGVMRFTEVVTTFWTDEESDPRAIMTSLSITLPPAPGSDAKPDGSTSGSTTGASAAESPSERPEPLLCDESEPLTLTDFVKYQGASGDFNRIHFDADFARSAGYPSPIAIGMLTAGLAATRVARVRDVRRLRSFRTRWRAQAWPGDRLTFEITPREPASDDVDVVVTRPGGEVHMQAWTEFA